MLIDQINLNQLRVFESVYRTKSMTHAARELHLTQSGVSQHIRALEEVLEIKLFDRVKQKLVPTPSAKELYKHTARGFEEIEGILHKLKKTDKELSGVVSVGVPIQFGNNIIIPMLAEFQKKNPRVTVKIRQGFPFEMNHLLLSGELDFAFVDSFAMDKGIKTEPVYNEVLELVAAKGMSFPQKAPTEFEFYEKLTYVDYQEDQSVLSLWMKHHLGVKNAEMNVRVYVMDALAIAKLVLSGSGAGVLPGHLVESLIANGESLQIIRPNSKPLINHISLAMVAEKTLSVAAKNAKEFLSEQLAQIVSSK